MPGNFLPSALHMSDQLALLIPSHRTHCVFQIAVRNIEETLMQESSSSRPGLPAKEFVGPKSELGGEASVR